MAALSRILRSVDGGRVAFWCPGCNEAHMIGVGDGPGPRWGYNNDPGRPTFTPSINVCGVQRITDEERDRIMRGERIDPKPKICHSFVTDGRIQFLGDCTHVLAGQTVDLPEWP